MLQQLMGFPEGMVVGFALILVRMIAFTVAMPIIGTPNVPTSIKILFPVMMSLLLHPAALSNAGSNLAISEMVILWAGREVLIGLFLGFFVRMFFFAVSVAGEIISTASGLSSAQLFNPAMGSNSGVMEQFQLLLATLLFLAINGHHFFIQGIAESFTLLPVGNLAFNWQVFSSVGDILKTVMIMGCQLAMPITVSMLISHLTMGIVGKAVPQINVLMTSLQVTILVTFLVLTISVPATTQTMNTMLNEMMGQFSKVLKAL